MLKTLFTLLLFFLISESNALLCNKTCGTGNCSELSYFVMNCAHCDEVKKMCAAAFCQNNPNLCDGNVPIQNLSIQTGDMRGTDNKILDVCMAPLFPEMTFNGRSNNSYSINALNGLDIAFFSQTGGATEQIMYERNLGTIKSLMASFLVYQHPNLHDDPHLKIRVDQELTVTYRLDIDHLTLHDFHLIAEDLRSKIYHLKGIETQFRLETHENKKYLETVSKLGCAGETSSSTSLASLTSRPKRSVRTH